MAGPPFSAVRCVPGERNVARVVLVVVLLVVAGFAAAAPRAQALAPGPAAASLTPHAPIDIESDTNFTAANGVVSGTGTAADPYVIAGWVITAPPSMGVQIRNTAVHVVVRDMEVTAASVAGFYFFGVSNVTLSNVTAYANGGDGVRFESSAAFAVVGCTVFGNSVGVSVFDSTRGRIQGTNVTLSTGDGVVLTNSPAVSVAGNNVTLNGFGGSGYGVHLSGTTNDTVTRNRFVGNGVFLSGAFADELDSHTITADNLISGLPILYEPSCTGLRLSGLALGSLLLANCRHAVVTNVTAAGGDVGIEVVLSSDVTLGPNVTVANAATGVGAYGSDSIAFVAGAILDSTIGFDVESSTNVLVADSKISAGLSSLPPEYAIAVHNSDHVNVTGNVMRHYLNGVESEFSGNLTVVGNVMAQNTNGFNAYRSRDVLLRGNLFVADASGVRLLNQTNATIEGNEILASLIDGANVNGSSAVTVRHNTFSGNAENSYDSTPAGDAWDGGYPAGGNYWGNYRGIDEYSGPNQNLPGPDGIGDTQYLFQVNAVDRYPLMAMPVSQDVPPEALFSVFPARGNILTVFSVNANLSWDYEDPLAQLQVRWAWDDGAAWGAWTATKYATHAYAKPGDHTIHLEVRDTAGLTDNWTWTVFVAPSPDTLPPVIVTAPPTSVNVGQALRITANITDASGLANATLLYRGVDAATFTAVPMGYANGTNYAATIPAQPHGGALVYVIYANDSWGNGARAPVGGLTTVQVVDPIVTFVLTVVVPAVVIAAAAVLVFLWNRRRKRVAPTPEAPPPPEDRGTP